MARHPDFEDLIKNLTKGVKETIEEGSQQTSWFDDAVETVQQQMSFDDFDVSNTVKETVHQMSFDDYNTYEQGSWFDEIDFKKKTSTYNKNLKNEKPRSNKRRETNTSRTGRGNRRRYDKNIDHTEARRERRRQETSRRTMENNRRQQEERTKYARDLEQAQEIERAEQWQKDWEKFQSQRADYEVIDSMDDAMLLNSSLSNEEMLENMGLEYNQEYSDYIDYRRNERQQWYDYKQQWEDYRNEAQDAYKAIDDLDDANLLNSTLSNRETLENMGINYSQEYDDYLEFRKNRRPDEKIIDELDDASLYNSNLSDSELLENLGLEDNEYNREYLRKKRIGNDTSYLNRNRHKHQTHQNQQQQTETFFDQYYQNENILINQQKKQTEKILDEAQQDKTLNRRLEIHSDPDNKEVFKRKKFKKFKDMSKLELGFTALNIVGAVGDYKDARREGKSVVGAAAKAGVKLAMDEMLGLPASIAVGIASAAPKLVVKGTQMLYRENRKMNSAANNQTFGDAMFQDTQQLATMRQSGLTC